MWKNLWILSSVVFIQQLAAWENHPNEYQTLDALALEAGADKSSNYHNYTQVYYKYFAPLRAQPIKFLEIGIYKGNSVKLWENYFPNAELHFIDITLDFVEYFSKRSQYHLGNQASPADLSRIMRASGGEFDVILDDGGHHMDQQIMSFQVLFPHVKSGGMYIIEDLHTSYWEGWNAARYPISAVNFLKGLIDELNFVGQRTARASHLKIDPSIAGELNPYREQIESIHFYDSIAIIIKR